MAKSSKTRRPALIVLVLLAAAGCLALGWWQWERFESSSGSGQNLGYAFQWPLFAGFVVFAYRRFVQLEEGPDEPAPDAEYEPREIPRGVLPQRPSADSYVDPTDDLESRQMLEYNTYLADLHSENDRSKS